MTAYDELLFALQMSPEVRPEAAADLIAAHDAVRTAASLSAAESQFLTFALDLAADAMASRGDEFTDDDEAALASLRRMAAEGGGAG